jgi:Uma2 family endonuclease
MATVSQPLTLDEFLLLPEEKPAMEYVDGEVAQKVSPQGRHAMLQAWLSGGINAFSFPRKLAIAFTELRSRFAGSAPVPDISVYRWDRIPRDQNGEISDRFEEAPDLAVAIVSPEQSANSLVRRCLWYVANGVRVALLVDPDDSSVIRFRPAEPTVALRGSERIELDDVLPGFQLTVNELFGALRLGG